MHTSGTSQLSDYLSDFFEKNKNVCAFCTAHIFEALFVIYADPSVGKHVILHICAKGFVLKMPGTKFTPVPGRDFLILTDIAS